MKWFKHHTDASRSEKLATLREKTGLDGYARYWLLVELLAEKFDGCNTTFRVNKRTLGIHLGYYRHTMAQQWLDIGQTLGLYNFHCEDDVYVIVFDKLLEIKDNHTRNLQVTSKLLAPRKEKKRKEKNITSNTGKFDVNLIYDAYPKKAGKAAGIKKLNSIIKSQEDFDKILHGAKLYSEYTSENNVELKYIKQFSTWVNQECWNDELETNSIIEAKIKDLDNQLENYLLEAEKKYRG